MRTWCEKNNFSHYVRYYQSLEQELYSDTLKFNFEKIPLLISKYANRFGRNWWLPLLCIIGVSLYLYFMAAFAYPRFTFYSDFGKVIIDKFLDGHIWTFMLPTHRLSTVFPNNTSGWVIFIDFLQRIVSGFLIYQFIRAFRFNFQNK
ncbi:MAG: hypothetical protein AAGF85_17765 [Bacteroidota bacterium]